MDENSESMFETITGTEPLENRQISPEQTSPLSNAERNSNSPTTESSEGLVTKSSEDPETKALFCFPDP